jgi:hypothetical protein
MLIFMAFLAAASPARAQAPQVTGHEVIGLREVDIVFSEPLRSGSGDLWSNYSVHETAAPANEIEIWGVWFGENRSTVRIVLYGPMNDGQSYTVSAENIVAESGSVIPPGYTYSFAAADAAAPGMVSTAFLSAGELEIIFTEDMEEAGAETPGNYSVFVAGDPADAIPVYFAKLRGVYDRVVLELEEEMVPGTSYTVAASGLEDPSGNGMTPGSSLTFVYDGENDRARIGLYADPDRVRTATDGEGLYTFDLWVWVEPGEGGAEAAVFGIDYPFGVSHEPPEYNPELSWPMLDINEGGMIIFEECRTEWTWICRQNVVVNTNDPGLISVFPVEDAGMQVAILGCEPARPIKRMDVCSNIEINCPDSRPVVLDAYFSGLRTIDLVFDVPMDGTTTCDTGNYEVFETASPEENVPVSRAVLMPGGETVRLTTGEDLAESAGYTVRINGVERTGGAEIRPDSEVEFTAIDVTPPAIVSAAMTGQHRIDVTFSEPVEESSALSLINYIFYKSGHIVSYVVRYAELLEGGETVRLETEPSLENGATYIIKVSNIEDLRGNEIKYMSKVSFIAEDVFPPSIVRIWSYPDNVVKVVFDEIVDPATAGMAANYRFGYYPIGINSVQVNGNEVTIALARRQANDSNEYHVYTRLIEDMCGNSAADWVEYDYYWHYLEDSPRPGLGLYSDLGMSSGRVDVPPMGFFTFYVFVRPGPNGSIGIEYALRNVSQDNFVYYITNTAYDENFSISIGEPFSGMGLTLYGCETDWYWMTRFDALLINGKGFIEIVPTDYRVLPLVVSCAYKFPTGDAEILSRISVNTSPETVISTTLQSSSANFTGDAIEVLWEMSVIDEGLRFGITRTCRGAEARLDPAGIESIGMSFRFVDDGIEMGEEYSYRVEYTVGEATHVLFESGAVSTPVMAFALRQNSPNPFNPSTTISYYLPSPCNIKLEIFDVAGRRIAVLKEGKADRGDHRVEWNGVDARGDKVSSGVYLYRLTAGKETMSRKMVLLK